MTVSRWWQILAGTLLIALGILFLLGALGVISAGRALATYWPLLLVILGLLILWTPGRWGPEHRGSPEKLIGDIRIGDEEWDLRDMQTGLWIGEMRLDLRRARIPPGETNLQVRAGIGKVTILLPADLPVSAQGEVGVGSLSLLGQKAEGFSRQLSFTSADYATAEKKVKVKLSLRFGEASIVRQS